MSLDRLSVMGGWSLGYSMEHDERDATMSIATISGSPDMNTGKYVEYLTDEEPSATIAYESNESGYDQEYSCKHCGAPVSREDDRDRWQDEDGDDECPSNEVDDNGHEVDEDDKLHASRWLNSARVTVQGEEVHAAISVGDPRGAFVFTIRMHPDGYLLMHVPTPDDSMPHMKLTELHAGTYRIG